MALTRNRRLGPAERRHDLPADGRLKRGCDIDCRDRGAHRTRWSPADAEGAAFAAPSLYSVHARSLLAGAAPEDQALSMRSYRLAWLYSRTLSRTLSTVRRPAGSSCRHRLSGACLGRRPPTRTGRAPLTCRRRAFAPVPAFAETTIRAAATGARPSYGVLSAPPAKSVRTFANAGHRGKGCFRDSARHSCRGRRGFRWLLLLLLPGQL